MPIRRFITALLLVATAVLVSPVIASGATEPPAISLKAANRYAKEATTEYYERLEPQHIHGSGDSESEVTFLLGTIYPCKRTSPVHFHCHFGVTATDRSYRGGELTEEKTNEVFGQETFVLVERAHAVSLPEGTFVFALESGWKVYAIVH